MEKMWMERLKNKERFEDVARFLIRWYSKKIVEIQELLQGIPFNFEYKKEFGVITHLGKMKVKKITVESYGDCMRVNVDLGEFSGWCICYWDRYALIHGVDEDYGYYRDSIDNADDVIFNEALYQAPEEFWDELEKTVRKSIEEESKIVTELKNAIMKDVVLERLMDDGKD